MHLLLISPPIEDFYNTAIRRYPLGILMLYRHLKHRFPNLHITVLDARSQGKQTRRIPQTLQYLEDYYIPDKSPFASFQHYQRFGMSSRSLINQIKQIQPSLVGISSMFTTYFPQIIELGKGLHRELPHLPVLIGGGHATLHPSDILSYPYFHGVIRGEGEIPLEYLFQRLFEDCWGMQALLTGENAVSLFDAIPGFCFRDSQGKHHIQPIFHGTTFPTSPMSLPPEWEPLSYKVGKDPMVMIQASRGCTQRCDFCVIPQQWGRTIRTRPIEGILNEMAFHVDRGIRLFDFEDDHLTAHRGWFRELMYGIINRFGTRKIQLTAMNGISYMDLTPELVYWMKEAGFSSLNISLVNTHHRMLQQVHRWGNVDWLNEVLAIADRLHMKVIVYIILGIPNQSIDSIIDSLIYLLKVPVTIGPSMFYHVPGSTMHQQFARETHPYEWYRLTALKGEDTIHYRKQTHTLFLLCRWINFLKAQMGYTGISVSKFLWRDLLRYCETKVRSIQEEQHVIIGWDNGVVKGCSGLSRQDWGWIASYDFLQTGHLKAIQPGVDRDEMQLVKRSVWDDDVPQLFWEALQTEPP
jgi:radical SAM superfamily enzyme YgiQ (UPF0313 family)